MKSTYENCGNLWSILLLGCLISVVSHQGSACQCFTDPPCEAYKHSGAVFVGELVRQQDSSFVSGNAGRLGILYTFKVTKWYKGAASERINVMSGVGGGDCGYLFEKGVPYLIYAHSIQDDVLYTDICARTRPLNEALIDLSYLDSLPGSTDRTYVWGTVMEFDSLTNVYIKFRPRPGVEVSTVSNGVLLKTVSDSLGNFTFIDLPPDSYKFNVVVPHNLALEYGDAYTKIRLTPSGCAMIPLTLVPNGLITGRVLDRDGKPVPNINVDLTPVDSVYSENAYLNIVGTDGHTNRNGEYSIRRVPPGKYYVGVNLIHEPRGRQPFPPTFHPGVVDKSQAQTIEMTLGEEKDSMDIFVRQQYPVIKIEGILKYSDGRPVRGYVTFDETRTKVLQAKQFAEGDADSTGHFSFPIFPGQKGWIHAIAYSDTALRNFVVTNPDPIEVTPLMSTRVLTLEFLLKPKR
jgi:hypothetical protein